MANGLFTSPEQVLAAEQQLRRAQAIQGGATPLGAAGQGLGRSIAGAFGSALGGGFQESPDMQMARTRAGVLQQADLSSREGAFTAAKALRDAGDIQGFANLTKHGLNIELPEPKKPEKVEGEYYQLTGQDAEGRTQQLGTTFVEKGKAIPPAGPGQSWYKIGTGTGVGDTNISVGAEMDAFSKSLGKQEAMKFSDQRKAAQTSVESLRTLRQSTDLLDKGVITGFGADAIRQMGKALSQVGLIEGESVANTEAFLANQGRAVLAIVGSGAVGAGTGISDKDIQFIKEVAGGTATLDEKGLRRIFTISEKAHKNNIAIHNRQARKVDKKVDLPYSTQVETPIIFTPSEVEQSAKNPKTNEVIYKVNGVWVDKQGYRYE